MSNSSTTPAVGSNPSLSLNQARTWALEAGFTEAGLVALPHAADARDADRFEEWISAGKAGTMRYLERRGEDGQLIRARVATLFPWARSAIVCFAGYHSAQPLSTEPTEAGAGWIARYACSSRTNPQSRRQPSDYHKVLKKRLEALEARIRAAQPAAFESRAYVDTGPVVERSLATAAGLGWTGKNTCLIHPKLGSFGFLAVLLTSLPVEKEEVPTAPALVPDHCGTCRRCIEACPTGALIAPYRMDATLCISYLTIEHKGPIAADLMAGMGRQVFGCDICQDVCPWNSLRRTPISADPELEPRTELVNPALDWLGSLDEQSFEQQFNGSPVRRAGFQGLRRNVAIAMGNSGQHRFAPLIEKWTEAADEGLRSAARWALSKLQHTGTPPPTS
ncbi:MAG TPA: tRNA epoxyqueuosine(34) reductase QueG [Terracidiphilus sp.]|nr:tRNA epoxyqueuosine(34) reductase QueG [Terracidiphilus sp.]